MIGVPDRRVQLGQLVRLTVHGGRGGRHPAAEEVGVEHMISCSPGLSGAVRTSTVGTVRTASAERQRPQRSAGVSTGASHSRNNSSSTWHSVTEQPAMSSEVT